MMKLWEIFRFELVYHLRRVSTWLYFLLLFITSFFMARNVFAAEAQEGGYFLNAPFAIAQVTFVAFILSLLALAALVGNAGGRDIESRLHPVIYAAPISKTDYLGGRFLAAFVLGAMMVAVIPAGLVGAVLLPGPRPELLGPIRPEAYAAAYFLIALPNVFIAVTTMFSAAVFCRRGVASYLGAAFVIFGAIMPFSLTAQAQPWWRILLDMFVILMVYDLAYYLTHRFAFHDASGREGPLTWMHAVHHRQHNPCRGDSSYIHPLEVGIGLGLYVGTIFALSRFMGDFHVVTVVVTFIVFSQVNLHNHDLWESDRFPFRYLNYTAEMHHNHHAKFTGGNFATITLLYDWMFGTLDHGDEHRARIKAKAKRAEARALEEQAAA